MPEAAHVLLAQWKLPVWLTLSLVVTALLYGRGWIAIRKTRPEQFGHWRLLAFLLGLASLWVGICSPLDEFADSLLSAHMVEHLLIMSLCPPLLLVAQPVVPLLRGVPAWLRSYTANPLLRVRALRKMGDWLVRPAVAWLAMNLAFLVWHIPDAYDFALEHERWHDVEHFCFLSTSLLFWWCVLRPWPCRSRNGWRLLIYLVAADVVNTLLSAFLALCNRPVYAYYATHPNPFGVSALSDQVLAGAIMWVFGSFVFLIPALTTTVMLLRSGRDTVE